MVGWESQRRGRFVKGDGIGEFQGLVEGWVVEGDRDGVGVGVGHIGMSYVL